MSNASLIGRQFDEYRLDELLGQGGMAQVYRAFDVRLKRWVAIKVIHAPFQADEDYMRRFEREAQAIAQLEHPHIVSIYRYGEVDSMLYIAMRYIEGSSLDAILRSYRDEGVSMPSAEISQIIRQICLALDYSHQQGVIHRDIKPANIMLDKQGQAILTDFGLVLVAEEGTQGEILGTPHYVAPEQAISSAGAVPQSDLYAMGVILYEMFAGEVPFDAADPLDIAMLHMTEEPTPPRQIRPEITEEVEAVILKTMAKEPEERYQSGTELSQALEQALNQRRITSSFAVTPVSISKRVADDLAARPLPPMPAGMTPPPPTKTAAPSAAAAATSQPAAASQVAPPSPSDKSGSNPLLYAVIGGLVVLLLLAGIGLGAAFLMMSNSDDSAGSQPPPAETVPAAAVVTDTATVALSPTPSPVETETETETETEPVQPTETPLPTETVPPATVTPLPVETAPPPTNTSIPTAAPPPTNTPIPTAAPPPTATPTATSPPPTNTPAQPQALANSSRDFSGSQGAANWHYQYTRGRESFDWTEMQFSDNCWRIPNEPSARLCGQSGHPGVNGDVAWRWTSSTSGAVAVSIYAAKLDQGGDGVQVLLYQGTSLIKSWDLGPTDAAGFSETLSLNVNRGDFLFFTLKIRGDSTNDLTAFRAQIFQ